MNKNIEIINDNLYLVNYEYVKAGFVKECSFVKDCDLVCITNDGKFILNKGDRYGTLAVPMLKQIMKLEDPSLFSDEGFYICTRGILRLPDYSNEDIEDLLRKNEALDSIQSYKALCTWEKQRREVLKESKKSNKRKYSIFNIFKKGSDI
jgi:hypothetical protein